jgi:hypothetical protein
MASKRMPLGGRRAELGVIDYTLAKRALLRDARIGVLGLTDVCDAHPELMRAARHVGEPTNNDCPVCAKEKLVLLAYVYGDGLKADSGRVWSIQTGLRMTAAHPGACCYVVEVCRNCQWNHLKRRSPPDARPPSDRSLTTGTAHRARRLSCLPR